MGDRKIIAIYVKFENEQENLKMEEIEVGQISGQFRDNSITGHRRKE